ncbi:hypothetical protein BDD12DRAFT_356605 [Trichophaea hybrida]|nr:hypothetical protein BDD12DRAFT_356605 [Trichophaea hybrida]
MAPAVRRRQLLQNGGEIYQSSWPYQCTDDSIFHCRWYPYSTKHGWTFLDLLKEDARLTESAGCELQRLATKLLLSASYGCHAFCCMRERITNTSNLKLYGRTYNPAILPIGENLRKFGVTTLIFHAFHRGNCSLPALAVHAETGEEHESPPSTRSLVRRRQ